MAVFEFVAEDGGAFFFAKPTEAVGNLTLVQKYNITAMSVAFLKSILRGARMKFR